MGKEIKRQIFLENLPKWGKLGRGKIGTINWELSIGNKVKFIYDGIEGWVEIIEYIKDTHSKIRIKYKNKELYMSCGHFKDCQLGKLLGKRTSEFKIKIGTRLKDDKRDVTITNRKIIGNHKYYKYECNLCGFDCGEHYKNGEYQEEHWIEESNLLAHNVGCACCCHNPRIVVEHINSIVTTDTWMIPYFQGGYMEARKYTKSSGKSIHPICPDCGKVRGTQINIRDIYRSHSINCKKCSDKISFPNKFAFNMLEQFKINFITEYSPEWIKPRRYDFHFEYNNKKYIIEMDGSFHNNDNTMSGQTVEESKAIDDYKDEQARLHGIEVIRIDCDYEFNKPIEYIKQNVLKNKVLNELFDLNLIDWKKVNEYACSNLVKVASKYKNDNPNLTVSQISDIMKMSIFAITKYLKIGNELSWCKYDSYEEMRKSGIKSGESSGNPVLCTTTNTFYKSGRDCSNESFNDFGVSISQPAISKACTRNVLCKGFAFRYITKEEYNKLKEVI